MWDTNVAIEKKEARIKCSGCGTSFKVKVPVTDKPVSFKCKKCGKVLKLKLKPATETVEAPAAPEESPGSLPGFEPTHLFDVDAYHRELAETKEHSPSVVEHLFLDTPAEAPVGTPDKGRRWIVLSADIIRGPFTDPEIVKMIQSREITADMSLRLGERPWIKACDVADFRHLFAALPAGPQGGMVGGGVVWEDEEHEEGGGTHFYEQIPKLLAYPVSGNGVIPLIIFIAIAFVLSTLLSWDFLIGLPINILGWVVLYGYLFMVMQTSKDKPRQAPPQWNLSAGTEFLIDGAKVLALLLVWCLVPVTICLLLIIAFFLNSLEILGYVFIVLTVLVYAGSLLAVPAGLVVLASSRNLGAALHPSRIVAVIKNGGQSYRMLTALSIGVGLVCMIAALSGVFLVDIPLAGFVVAGLVMALLLSYGNFVWFHGIGRFCQENSEQMKQVASA
jgi:predicted RNA-binding Zn-ribbon protein involved in translation (DUF1610 family)